MSPERLREALKWSDREGDLDRMSEGTRVIVEAARAYADLLENGQEMWWCTEHERAGNRVSCDGRVKVAGCPMVKVRVVPVEEDA